MPTALVRRKAGYENSPCADEKARLRVISATAQPKASRFTRTHCGAILVARGSRRWSDASPGAATLAHLRARRQLELRGQELASLIAGGIAGKELQVKVTNLPGTPMGGGSQLPPELKR